MTIATRLYTIFCGSYVGTDTFGNRYYTERASSKGGRRKRWVLYKGIPEASKVPALWHGWLHHTFDATPDEMPRVRYDWEQEHLPNLTGTKGAYLPAGHVKRGASREASTSDYQAWQPRAKAKKDSA